MNFFKGYVGAISEFVSGVIGENEDKDVENVQSPTEPTSSHFKGLSATNDPDLSTPSESNDISSAVFNWIPKLQKPTGENAVVYYMNRLASLGGDSPAETSEKMPEKDQIETVITSDVPSLDVNEQSNTNVSGEPNQSPETNPGSWQLDEALVDWMTGFSSRTGQVWKQMKQDFGEVVNVVSKEPRDTVSRTASAVRQHITSMADAALKIDPKEFALLPEPTERSEEKDSCLAPEDKIAAPPKLSDLPSLSSLRSDVSHLLTGFMSSLFGSDESTQTVVKDRREARLQIIRADPATYECEPVPPPPHLGVSSYADWRSAYFDESTCQPRPGIPLCGARDLDNKNQTVESLIAPPHPTPEELLDQYPFMRTYLTQLVQVEGQPGGKGLTDADFWSRYYYRVWLLDVTERRRQRLAERVASTTPVEMGSTSVRLTEPTKEPNKLGDADTDDWFADSDGERSTSCSNQDPVIRPKVQPTTPSINNVNRDCQTLDSITEAASNKTNKSAAKGRRKRVKKRSGSASHAPMPHCSDSESPIHREATATLDRVRTGDTKQDVTTISSSELSRSKRLIAESDELITSGSSSVVVLSNSEDETDGRSSEQIQSQKATIDTLVSDVADASLGDWGDASDEESRHTSEPIPLVTESKVHSEQTKSSETADDEIDDWENWN